MEDNKKISPEVFQEMFEMGLFGIEVPEKYGGTGLNYMNTVLAIEEMAKVDSSVAAALDVQNTLFNRTILTYGTEEQKETYLPELATKALGSFALSEASSGSDAFALKTRATEENGEFVINGTKQWITNSREATYFIVMANVDPDKGYKGITPFIVERSNPGISVSTPEDKVGMKASSTCEVVFDNCRVPRSAVLGGDSNIGKGYKIAIDTLNEGRIGIGAQQVGLAQGAFNHAFAYAHERKQFGRSVADFQGMQFQFAKAATEIEAARLLVYNAARKKEAGENFVQEAAMCKYYAAEVAGSVATQAVQWMGGVGITTEFKAERFYRDWILGSIYEGTGNINLQTIAKCLSNKLN